MKNGNQKALSLQQVENFPLVDNLTLTQYIKSQTTHKENFRVDEFSQEQFKPDIIFYLIASDKQFLRDDCIYLQDLLQHHHQIIYVLNTYTNKQASDSQLATSQNIADIVKKIHKVHTSVLGETSQPEIVKLNCCLVEGITELITSTRQQMLGVDKGRLFDELISYQNEKTPDEFVYQVKLEILRLIAYIACQKPDNTSSSEESLHNACNTLWEFIATLLDRSQQIPCFLQELINAQVNLVISKCTVHHYEKVKQKKSKAIYKSVPVFKIISEQVPDYSSPIKEKRTVWVETSNVFKGMKNLAKYGEYGKKKKVYEVVGYHTKTVTRQIIDGYEEEYSHTEYWEEETGEVKIVGTSYSYFGYSAVYLLLTLAHMITSEVVDNSDKFPDIQNQYESLNETISNRVNKLPDFPLEPKEKEINNILITRIDRLFDAFFTRFGNKLR